MSRPFREYGVEETARQQCARLGLSPEAASSYARQSAPFTHPDFTHRYEEFVFRVRKDVIEEVGLFSDYSPQARLRGDVGARERAFALLSLLEEALPFLEVLVSTLTVTRPSGRRRSGCRVCGDATLNDDRLGKLELLIDRVENQVRVR